MNATMAGGVMRLHVFAACLGIIGLWYFSVMTHIYIYMSKDFIAAISIICDMYKKMYIYMYVFEKDAKLSAHHIYIVGIL
jgi:hypothetical protein